MRWIRFVVAVVLFLGESLDPAYALSLADRFQRNQICNSDTCEFVEVERQRPPTAPANGPLPFDPDPEPAMGEPGGTGQFAPVAKKSPVGPTFQTKVETTLLAVNTQVMFYLMVEIVLAEALPCAPIVWAFLPLAITLIKTWSE